jgi:hypothetical protein
MCRQRNGDYPVAMQNASERFWNRAAGASVARLVLTLTLNRARLSRGPMPPCSLAVSR